MRRWASWGQGCRGRWWGGGVGRVGAVGLMCAELECNIDMHRSIGTGRQRSGLSRTTTRTGSTPPWSRTRRSMPLILSLTLGGTRGTTSYLSTAASFLGARGTRPSFSRENRSPKTNTIGRESHSRTIRWQTLQKGARFCG